jgi:CheY-like chemotaxis protein
MPSTLLLVDDKPANLIALEAVLKQDGYRILTAGSGPEAVYALEHNHVDLILLDIQMPGMDGFETARRIREREPLRDIPIIFITAIFKEDPHVKMGYEAGGIDYFTKPFDPDILRMKISIYASFRQRETLLREREVRIRESERLLEAGRKLSEVLEGLPVGVIIADTEGRIVETNDTVLKIWKSIEPAETDSYGEFLRWWVKEGHAIKSAFSRALSSGESTHNETITIHSFDGTARILLSSVSPLRGMDQRVVGAVSVVQDITEHKKIEEDIEERVLKLVTSGAGLEPPRHASG